MHKFIFVTIIFLCNACSSLQFSSSDIIKYKNYNAKIFFNELYAEDNINKNNDGTILLEYYSDNENSIMEPSAKMVELCHANGGSISSTPFTRWGNVNNKDLTSIFAHEQLLMHEKHPRFYITPRRYSSAVAQTLSDMTNRGKAYTKEILNGYIDEGYYLQTASCIVNNKKSGQCRFGL